MGVTLAILNHLSEGTSLRQASFGRLVFLKSGIFLVGLALVALTTNAILILFVLSLEEMRQVWNIMTPRLLPGLGIWMSSTILAVNFLMGVRRKVGTEFVLRYGGQIYQFVGDEVGDLKRDIAYHGDPLNTAARLLKLCPEYGRPILIAGRIQSALSSGLGLPTEPLGELLLRAKEEPVAVFGVEA